jgi:hypothetical protein
LIGREHDHRAEGLGRTSAFARYQPGQPVDRLNAANRRSITASGIKPLTCWFN